MHLLDGSPQTPEEGVLHAFMRIGRRMRARQPGDAVDHSLHIVLFQLKCTGAIRLSDLAAKVEVDASTMSRHIRSLEQAGLVQRSPDPNDGRATRVELTEHGLVQFEAASKRRQELLTQAMAGWDIDDIKTFERLMSRFADGVNNVADERAASPETTEALEKP
ncbi:MarR family winged helix-turn-helix transcriptional regulator [Kribbella deserti]|uniref:MarR family winged helix-turn-helix transcriptional regulator n=1 Tax=Kribbella deserti TaxID=1926257 RepID=A0ABV6QMY2_9ACTN